MPQVYFASDYTGETRDGSQGNPYLDPSELPTPWVAESGNEYLFRCDTETNFEDNFRTSDTTASPVLIGSWGSGARPIITAYRLLDGSECVECDVDTSGALAVLTIPPAGGPGSTNLWRVPKTFFGLFAGDVWGVCTDIGGYASASKVVPTAAREWCGAVANTGSTGVAGGYGLIYSEGNPVEVYGGVYASSLPEVTWGNTGRSCTFATKLALGGFELSGLELRRMFRAYMAFFSDSTATRTLALHSINDLVLKNIYRGPSITGYRANSPYTKYSSLRVYGNYAENLGNQFFDTSGNIGVCINDGRIYRNVVNGFAKAYSTGGIYLPGVYTTDGERLKVYENTLSNGEADHFWPIDGAALMVEENGGDIEFSRNFLWNCERNCNANCIGSTYAAPNIVYSNNVVIAPDTMQTDSCTAFRVGCDDLAMDVTLRGNVAVGFVRFADYNAPISTSRLNVLGNISYGSGAISGSGNGSFFEAIRSGTADTARLTIDGNNFYGHYADLRNYSGGATYNSAPEVNNRITSDPSAELARLPVPVDPTVNYALQIRPGARIVNGAVDLRPGTRVA